jgi:large subunit ribosomal protein L13
MKTYTPRPQDVERRWYVVDADGVVLGRLASEVAKILRGKHKPIFAPHADTGDHVVVVNAEGIRLTGGKEEKKIDYRHSGYPGGLRETPYTRLLSERPVYVVEKAIRGMLPKNRLGRAMVRKLQVYPGPEHPHAAQKPVPLSLGQVPAWDGLPVPAPKKEKPEAKKPATRPKGRARSNAPAAKRTTAKRTSAKATTAKRTAAKRPAAKATTAKRTGSAKAATANAGETAKPKRRTRRTKRDEEG